jgi:hypothetical protein
MERKGITPGNTNFGVASSNAGVHFINLVLHVSTVPRTQVTSLSCLLLRLDFVHARFVSLSCPALLRLVLICFIRRPYFVGYMGAVHMSVSASVCLLVSVCVYAYHTK